MFSRTIVIVAAVFIVPAYGQQSTTGYCSPVISNVTGSVTTNCFTTVTSLRSQVQENLDGTILELNQLLVVNRSYLLPAIGEYRRAPTAANWESARWTAKLVLKRLANAVDSAIKYDASLRGGVGSDLWELHSMLATRLRTHSLQVEQDSCGDANS
jgi:hypothetical protein